MTHRTIRCLTGAIRLCDFDSVSLRRAMQSTVEGPVTASRVTTARQPVYGDPLVVEAVHKPLAANYTVPTVRFRIPVNTSRRRQVEQATVPTLRAPRVSRGQRRGRLTDKSAQAAPSLSTHTRIRDDLLKNVDLLLPENAVKSKVLQLLQQNSIDRVALEPVLSEVEDPLSNLHLRLLLDGVSVDMIAAFLRRLEDLKTNASNVQEHESSEDTFSTSFEHQQTPPQERTATEIVTDGLEIVTDGPEIVTDDPEIVETLNNRQNDAVLAAQRKAFEKLEAANRTLDSAVNVTRENIEVYISSVIEIAHDCFSDAAVVLSLFEPSKESHIAEAYADKWSSFVRTFIMSSVEMSTKDVQHEPAETSATHSSPTTAGYTSEQLSLDETILQLESTLQETISRCDTLEKQTKAFLQSQTSARGAVLAMVADKLSVKGKVRINRAVILELLEKASSEEDDHIVWTSKVKHVIRAFHEEYRKNAEALDDEMQQIKKASQDLTTVSGEYTHAEEVLEKQRSNLKLEKEKLSKQQGDTEAYRAHFEKQKATTEDLEKAVLKMTREVAEKKQKVESLTRSLEKAQYDLDEKQAQKLEAEAAQEVKDQEQRDAYIETQKKLQETRDSIKRLRTLQSRFQELTQAQDSHAANEAYLRQIKKSKRRENPEEIQSELQDIDNQVSRVDRLITNMQTAINKLQTDIDTTQNRLASMLKANMADNLVDDETREMEQEIKGLDDAREQFVNFLRAQVDVTFSGSVNVEQQNKEIARAWGTAVGKMQQAAQATLKRAEDAIQRERDQIYQQEREEENRELENAARKLRAAEDKRRQKEDAKLDKRRQKEDAKLQADKQKQRAKNEKLEQQSRDKIRKEKRKQKLKAERQEKLEQKNSTLHQLKQQKKQLSQDIAALQAPVVTETREGSAILHKFLDFLEILQPANGFSSLNDYTGLEKDKKFANARLNQVHRMKLSMVQLGETIRRGFMKEHAQLLLFGETANFLSKEEIAKFKKFKEYHYKHDAEVADWHLYTTGYDQKNKKIIEGGKLSGYAHRLMHDWVMVQNWEKLPRNIIESASKGGNLHPILKFVAQNK